MTSRLCCLTLLVLLHVRAAALAELPNPVLNSVFPAGGQAGTTVNVMVAGGELDGLTTLRCSHAAVDIGKGEHGQFTVTIPKDTPPGLYDLRAVGRNGLSSPRTFFVGNQAENVETEPNETPTAAHNVPLDVVINGRIDKGGDVDQFRFRAKRGQRVVIECWALRIDSSLRAVLELTDAEGRTLAVSRGQEGFDPLIDFRSPADGDYVVKLTDLTYTGSADHIYRLDIDTGPRVAVAVPAVIQRGRTTSVTLLGWNLRDAGKPTAETSQQPVRSSGQDASSQTSGRAEPLDRIEVEITPPASSEPSAAAVRRWPHQVSVDGFAYQLPGGHLPIWISTTDVPVVEDHTANSSPEAAQQIELPCEVSGQLIAGDERDWFVIDARQGEVIWLEAFGQRIGSPLDLDISVLDETGENQLARFSDELDNIGETRFPSSHLDPSGRWVVPSDGRYLILVRDLIGGLDDDPRRVYRLSVRRQTPDFHLAVVSPRSDAPAGLNVPRGGRAMAEVLAFRRRGLDGPIRVTATDLPPGIECPEIWLGPGVNRAPLVLTASAGAEPVTATLNLVGEAELGGVTLVRRASGGTMIRAGLPNGLGRVTSTIPLAVALDAPLQVSAGGSATRLSQGSVIDIAVRIERRDAAHRAAVRLTGVGLPELVHNHSAAIAAGQDEGHVSFYLPPTLPPGPYTIAVRAETTAPYPTGASADKQKDIPLTVYSNPITFEIYPAPFVLGLDLDAPRRIRRGQIVRLNYTAKRKNGFIGKIHTELAAPGEVIGLRARGVTFVGQTETGTLQIIASDDAPLGRQPFLRLEAVGTVEDEPVYHASCFFELEIIQ